MRAAAVRQFLPDPESRFENPGDRRLHGLGRGGRIFRVADRPADDDVVGAVPERLRYVDDALLVGGIAARGPDSRSDGKQFRAQFVFYSGNFQTRTDNTVAASLRRRDGARENQVFEPAAIALLRK